MHEPVTVNTIKMLPFSAFHRILEALRVERTKTQRRALPCYQPELGNENITYFISSNGNRIHNRFVYN